MIKHEDYDDGTEEKIDFVLPSNIDSISVTHDGGRMEIYVNDCLAYKTMTGTRDCCITIDKEKM